MSANSSVTDITASDMFLSLNGFDELAVAKAFGSDVAELREAPMRFMRALAFIHRRREGDKDAEAYKAAMNLTIEEAGNYFAPDLDEVDPDDPVTEAGKDDAPSR